VSQRIWAPDRRLLTAGLIALVTAAAFEGMAVPTVMPALVDELDGLELYGWTFSAFWLTNIIGITLGGSESDRSGPARPLVLGVVLFAAGLVVSGLAPTMPVVIAGRAIQGFGAGAVSAVVYAVIARAYATEAQPRMIALVSSAWVIPGLVGPALAGVVTDWVGWRWIFLAVVPPVLVTAAALWSPLARLGPARTAEPGRSDARRAIDAIRLAAGSTLMLAVPFSGSAPLGALMLIVGAWLAVGALRHLVPAGTLRAARGRPAVIAAIFVIGFAFFGTEAFLPLTVVELRGASVTVGGIALSAAAVTWSIGSWLQARFASRGTRRALVLAGSTLIGVGIVVIATVLLPSVPIAVAAVGWAIGGLGMGLAYSMLTLLVLETATPGEEGFSSSALALMFTLGTALGAGVGGAVVALADAGTLELATALGVVFAVMLAAAVGAFGIALRIPRTGEAHPRFAAANATTAGAGLPLEHP
jgi:MFS family permease